MGLIAILFFLISFACNAFWQAGMTAIMLQNFSIEGKRLYYSVMKSISFTMITICFAFAVINGQFIDLTIWNALFFLCCVPVGVLIVKSIRAKASVFESKPVIESD